MDDFKRLIGLAWEEDSDVEELDDLLEKCRKHNITVLNYIETNPPDTECTRTETEQMLCAMKSMADGTSNVNEGDLAFVSSRVAVNAFKKIICDSGEDIFLTIEHRNWIEPYLEALKRLDLNGHVDCSTLEDIFFQIKKIPLELIWWLQSKGFVQLHNYVSSTMANTDKTKKLNADLWTLVVNCNEDMHDDERLSDSQITRRMTKDLLTNLITAAHLDAVDSAEACTVLIGSIVKGVVKRVTTESSPTLDLLGLLRNYTAGSADRDLSRLALQMLTLYMAQTPYVPLPRAMSSQTDWVHKKNSTNVNVFVKSALECLGVEESIKMIQAVVRDGEVNWRHLMAIVSTLVVTLPDGKSHLADLLECLVREALFNQNRDLLTASFLLARQCCLESTGCGFPPYDVWFSMTFGVNLTAPAFTFLLRFLSDLVPCEPAYCLQAHLRKPLLGPVGCERAWQDYVTLIRCRLADLKLNAARSLLGLTSAAADVELVAQHWATRRELLPSLMPAARLQKAFFEKEWLPCLLSSPHKEVVEKLISLRLIPNSVLERHAEKAPGSKLWPLVAAAALEPKSPLARLENSLSRFLETLGIHWVDQDTMHDATNLVERLTLTNLTERMPLANHEQMVEALSFCVDYLAAVSLRQDLPKPVGLPKLIRYLCERLGHCPRSHQHGFPDSSDVPGSDTMDLREFLAQESKITSEFLASPVTYMEQALISKHVPVMGIAKTATALLLAAFRPWAEPAVRKVMLVALGTVAEMRGDEGGVAIPWMLKCWVQMVPGTCNHQEFFRVASQLPRWLLLSDCRSTVPSQDFVLRLAAFVNAELVVGLAEGSFLCPSFVWHLTVMLSQWSDARLFSVFLDKCPAYHVALLMNGWSNLSHLSLAFPPEPNGENESLSLTKLLKFHRHIGQSKATVDSCLSLAAPWEVALVIYASATQAERREPFPLSQREILSSHMLSPWLFYFHLLNLLDKIERNEGKFSVSCSQVSFISENVLEPSPLLALSSIFTADAKAVNVLMEDSSLIPMSGLSSRTVKLVSVTGLLFLLREKLFEASAQRMISEVLKKLKAVVAQSHSLLPKFFGPDWKYTLTNMNKLCVDLISTTSCPVVSSEPDIYIIDDDIFMIPDDLP